ncbi:uncharacterized protein LOC113856093 [Abrus precatorius]|uniref:Uncharacterized protein LOC113856093 n=1 Tax=Abrus precatorius TaxID=3816 RepID=A0A8B8KIB3_ABRPR|nr:uncharacterized protein LOC113856093 [Abrus precatorius]XP_027343563.1 uncharacterized protein LOC113856093 [Abrus precatorius]
MAFEDFEPIFREPKVERPSQSSCPLGPFLIHAFALHSHSPHIVIRVTDFVADAWEARLSLSMLEDIRDSVGIGGSWSEFADYFVTSLKSEDLKLILEANSNSDDVSHAKLVAQRSKGMPLITIPLTKLVDSTAIKVRSNVAFSLFEAMRSKECSLVKEQEHSVELTNMLAAEKERNETIQLEQRQKFQKLCGPEKGVSNDGLQNSPDKQAAWDTGSTKIKNRAMPAYRRTKVRGALLHDSDK